MHYKDLVSLGTEDEWSKVAPLRILSFDIECLSEVGEGFPTADKNAVIQIAAYVKEQGQEKPVAKVVWALDTCDDIPGSVVASFPNTKEGEAQLFNSFREFVQIVDPDILTGYNINNFDFPYLIDRLDQLRKDGITGVQDFCLGRSRGVPAKMKESSFARTREGREAKEITLEGRVIMDMFVIVMREHKLRSYSLNAVSAEFLGEQKEDVHYSIMSELQKGTSEQRKRLAVYCLKDAYLPLRLFDKLLIMFNYLEMARVTGVPLMFLLNRGQMIKVTSQIYRKGKTMDFIVPTQRTPPPEDKFEGATVLDPKTGFYNNKQPITTLDFASLYPSIMMAHNLCYTTLISAQQAQEMDPEDYTKTPCNSYFVKEHKQKGLLPIILNELLSARKRAKKLMKDAKDPMVASVMNGRQLALKISANSVYGFTGAQVGQMPCLQISSSVTAFGRQMIDQTKSLVEEKYQIAKGYEHDAEVVYGDTDSVFIKFGCETVEESMKLGEEAAAHVSKTFIKPIKLEFEKVYCPFLLMAKKRYVGLYWTRPDKYDKVDAKGMETVRRDNCGLVRMVCDEVVRLMLIENSQERAMTYVKGVISDLLQNKIDLSLLVISKSMSKPAHEYDAKQAHVRFSLYICTFAKMKLTTI